MSRLRTWALAFAACAAVLAGCAPPAPSPESPPAAQRIDQARVAGDLARTNAVAPRLTVERLGLGGAPLVELGLAPNRTLEVPPVETPQTVGFYRLGPRPGARGPAVILGHVNGGGQPGAFARLDTVRVGDRITINDQARVTTFRVTRIAAVPKEQFPTDEVYSDTRGPELRLITCGGAFDGEDYRDNVIVWAQRAS